MHKDSASNTKSDTLTTTADTGSATKDIADDDVATSTSSDAENAGSNLNDAGKDHKAWCFEHTADVEALFYCLAVCLDTFYSFLRRFSPSLWLPHVLL